MAERTPQFEIYRLNVVDEDTFAFDFMGRNIRGDGDIRRTLETVADQRFDLQAESGRTTYIWSARQYVETYPREATDGELVCILTLARSTFQQEGQTVTERSVERAITTLSPPPADTIHLLFYMRRHLVIVEYNSAVMQSQVWRESFETMLDRAAASIELLPGLRLEPVPKDEEIIGAFRSFQRLTRLRVRLRIPNPELQRRTERLKREMVASGIREYTQDMRNPGGLSQNEECLPYATAAMAQAGYKDGEVIMTGFRNGKRVTVRTGKRAARGRIEAPRDAVHEIGNTANTPEGRRIVLNVLDEADRLVEIPPPLASENQSSKRPPDE